MAQVHTLSRQKTSLQNSTIELLNKQMEMEAHASMAYLAMSAWCHENDFIYSGEYFKKQAHEEREHMLKIYDFLIETGARALAPEVKNVNNDFTELKEVLETYLSMEIEVTESINKIYDSCLKSKDFQAMKLLEWFLNEQIEEEDNARRTLEIYDLIGTELDGLFKIDYQIGQLAK